MKIHPRIKDVLMLAPIPLALLIMSPWTTWLLLVVIGFLALWEFRFIILKRETVFYTDATRLAFLGFFVTMGIAAFSLFFAILSVLVSLCILYQLERIKPRFELLSGYTLISIIAIMAFALRKVEPSADVPYGGLSLLGLALVITSLSDSGAYFVGKAIGRNKFAPVISPNKTWEGVIGGWIFGVLGAFIYIGFLLPGLWKSNWLFLIILFWALAFAGQMGDLAESALKRKYGVKDSGTTLRSHGGILDRFDSLAFVLPLLTVFIYAGGYA